MKKPIGKLQKQALTPARLAFAPRLCGSMLGIQTTYLPAVSF